jgi:hypothetical protein
MKTTLKKRLIVFKKKMVLEKKEIDKILSKYIEDIDKWLNKTI